METRWVMVDLIHLMVVTAWPNMPNIVRFGPYRPHGFVPGDASPLLSLTSQNTFNMLEPALIRPATHPSPADVGSYNPYKRKITQYM